MNANKLKFSSLVSFVAAGALLGVACGADGNAEEDIVDAVGVDIAEFDRVGGDSADLPTVEGRDRHDLFRGREIDGGCRA